jgi:hypothetical protein
MRNRFLSLIATLLGTALIFGCSGGSSSSTPDATTTTSSGTISDPYIYNAWFDEISATDGATLQSTTGVSDIKGNFTFPDALTAGSTITMRTTAGVMHATPLGALTTYEGPILTRRVSQELVDDVADGKEVIVTPLTTYAEQLQTAAEVAGEPISESEAVDQIVTMINNASDGDLVRVDNLFDDPMAAFETGGDNDPSLLQASMAVNIALEATVDDFDATFDAALVLVQTILPKNEDGSAPSEEQFVAANVIIEVVASSETPDVVAAAFETSEINAIIAVVEDLADGEVVVVDADGGVDTIDYQALFDTEFAAAKVSFLGNLEDGLDGINAELIAGANAFNQVKSTLELAKETGTTVTVTQNDEDTLNFFYAFSRVALLANPLTDSNPDNGLQRLSDILDALGAPADDETRTASFGLETCTDTIIYDGNGGTWTETDCTSTLFTDHANIPTTTPSGSDLQQFIYQRASAELQNAVVALGEVSANFDLELTNNGIDTDFDNGDVLYIKAAANAALFQTNLLQGLNLDADIKALAEIDSTDSDTMQDALNVTTDGVALKDSLLKTKDTAALTAAKVFAVLAVDGMKEAIAAMEAETDAQENDFINFFEVDAIEQAAMISDTIADLDKALELLTGATTFDDITMDLSGLFAGTVDLNSLLPTFTDNTPSLFSDATLGGMLSGALDINADEYGDGVPDIIQDGLVNFTDSMLRGKAYFFNSQQNGGLIEFAAEGQAFTIPTQALSGIWELAEDGSYFELTYTVDNVEMTDTMTFDSGWQDVGFLEFDFTWTTGDEVLDTWAVEVEQITEVAFTSEMLTNQTMHNQTYPMYFSFYKDLDGVDPYYGGKFSGNYDENGNEIWLDFNGIWGVSDDVLTLTPDESCTFCTGPSTFTITKGYVLPWGETYFVFNVIKEDGTVLTPVYSLHEMSAMGD